MDIDPPAKRKREPDEPAAGADAADAARGGRPPGARGGLLRAAGLPVSPPVDGANLDLAEGLIDVACDLLHVLFPNTSALNAAPAGIGGTVADGPAQHAPFPLRMFVQEMIRRSCSSFATFELALFYLVRSEPNIPAAVGQLQRFAPLVGDHLGPPSPPDEIDADPGAEPARYLASPPLTPSFALPSPGLVAAGRQPLDRAAAVPFGSMTPRLRTVSGPATLSQDPTNLKPLTHPSHCARRMLLASLVVSWKILHDKTFSSRAWSKITGLTASEISNNEMIFLRDLLRWDMFVDRNLFWNWSSELEKAAWGAAQMREVRKEKRECRPAEQAGIVHRADADMDSMLAQIDDGSVRNYSASNLVYFLPAYRMTRAASVH